MRWVGQHQIYDDDYYHHHPEEDIHNVDDNVDYDNDDEKTRKKNKFPVPVQYKLCTPWSVMEYSYSPNNSADTNHIIIQDHIKAAISYISRTRTPNNNKNMIQH